MRFIPLIALLLLRSVQCEKIEPDQVLEISEKEMEIGNVKRLFTVINGTIPGPKLEFVEGTDVWIKVINKLPDRNTTMHWHGLAQNAALFSDGTPQISQWPIPPTDYKDPKTNAGGPWYFDYQLHIPKGSAGTYFYHSHIGFQLNSAGGPLIIREASDTSNPYHGYPEQTLFVQDLSEPKDTVFEDIMASPPKGGSSGTPPDGPRPGKLMLNGEISLKDTKTGKFKGEMGVIKIEPGQKTRLRFIGATIGLAHTIGIQHHSHALKIIEADGHFTKPVATKFMQVASGQRYSALLQAKTCEELKEEGRSEYYIELRHCGGPNRGLSQWAKLKYDVGKCSKRPADELETLPNVAPDPSKPPVKLGLPTLIENHWMEDKLTPLAKNEFPSSDKVTETLKINVQAYETHSGILTFQIGGQSWVEDTEVNHHSSTKIPYLVALYKNLNEYVPSFSRAEDNKKAKGVDPKTGAIPIKSDAIVDIIIQNVKGKDTTAHPMHLHGQHYWYLGGGKGAFSQNALDKQLDERTKNGVEPILRDTALIFDHGSKEAEEGDIISWSAWRWKPNRGAWMIHCHILPHMLQGMQIPVIVGEPSEFLVDELKVEGYLEYGGSVYGNVDRIAQPVDLPMVGTTP